MIKQITLLLLSNVIFFTVHNLIWRFIINDGSLAMFAIMPFIMIASLVYAILYGFFTQKKLKKFLFPHCLICIFQILSTIDLIFFSNKVLLVSLLQNIHFMILPIALSIISSLITRAAINKKTTNKHI